MCTAAFCPVSLTCFFFLLRGWLHLITFDGRWGVLGLNALAMSLERHRLRASVPTPPWASRALPGLSFPSLLVFTLDDFPAAPSQSWLLRKLMFLDGGWTQAQ